MKYYIYHKDGKVKMFSKKRMDTPFERTLIDVTEAEHEGLHQPQYKKIKNKKLVFEPFEENAKKERVKERLEEATTLEDLKTIIQDLIT